MAQLVGFRDIEEILSVFAEKIICNLMSSSESEDFDEKRVVKMTLECFQNFLLNDISQCYISKVPIVRQLATSHISQFPHILQGSGQIKQLGVFYSILTLLWLQSDFIEDFSSYLD